METHVREYLVSQIVYGAKIIEFKDKTLIIQPPTIEQKYLSNRFFRKVYDEALLSGVYTRNEMLEIMKEQEVWSDEHEKQIDINTTRIEDAKIKIYKSFFNPARREAAREELEEIKRRQYSLLEIKHGNNQNDCEGVATFARWNWIIENTTYNQDGTKYDFSDYGISTILRRYNSSGLEIEQFRELARNDPWRSMWSIGQSPESLFNRRTSELSSDQQNIMSWSRLYDTIGESHESPSDKIIEDDDAIDGWLIQERRKREKESNKYKLDGYDDKHGNADEVYIMASSQEEIDEVYDLNDPEGRMKVKGRQRQVAAAGEEGVSHRNFNDMKIKKMNDAAAKFGK
tara:strand:- start:541 stop:1569 length:1029 start_codon:yes stop_codon:yes gene_type:complete